MTCPTCKIKMVPDLVSIRGWAQAGLRCENCGRMEALPKEEDRP